MENVKKKMAPPYSGHTFLALLQLYQLLQVHKDQKMLLLFVTKTMTNGFILCSTLCTIK